ncbi:MAG: hypothetical protein WA160_01565 [Pseudobdellovibrio sp.]
MIKKNIASKKVKRFLKDLKTLTSLPISKKYQQLHLEQFAFDAQLISLSRLYRQSRTHYYSLDGVFVSNVSSMMRSLSAQDLFKNAIDYTPSMSEMMWFMDHFSEVVDPEIQVEALMQFNQNSLFHEQNHRVIWQLLPPAPKGKEALRRYLNFAESLVVTLDLALGDEIGSKYSSELERMGVIYRPAGDDLWMNKSKSIYRKYLLSLFATTYYALELINHKDILKAVDYIFPNQKLMNKNAVSRGLELSELFTLNTNPQWQNLNWQQAQNKLAKIHQHRTDEPFQIAADPLDLNIEFAMARSVLDFYGL